MIQPLVAFAIATSITLVVSTTAVGINIIIAARTHGTSWTWTWTWRDALVLFAFVCQIGYCADEAALGMSNQKQTTKNRMQENTDK